MSEGLSMDREAKIDGSKACLPDYYDMRKWEYHVTAAAIDRGG